MKQGEIHFHFPREKVRCYFNSYTTLEKPKKNKNKRRHSQIIKKEDANQEKEVVKAQATLETKEEESQEVKPKTQNVWRKKETTPLSTPSQQEESLSPSSSDIQGEKAEEDSTSLDTPSSA